jgi:hypothetical protein
MAGSLVPLTGPYGTYQIPSQVAPAFGMDPAAFGPPPTFQPGELEGAVLGDVPRVAEPPLPPQLPYMAPEQPPDVAPSVTRGPLSGPAPQPLIGPDETVPMPAPRAPEPQQAAAPAPGSLPSMYANIEQRKDIARRRGEVEGQAATAEADILDEANREDDRLAKERQVARDAANKEIGAARAKQASALDAYVNHKVDQNRLWHSMGTGSKIMAGIGIMLSGLGNALAKKGDARNPALDMIMGAIQDDVRLQLAERDKLGQVAAMRKDAVNDLRTQYQDGEAAYGALVAGNTARVQNMLKSVAARAKDPAAKLRAEGLINELGAEKDKIALASQEREAAAQQQAFQNQMAKSQLGLGWANFKRGAFESDRDFLERQRQADMANEAAIGAAKAKGGEELAKQYREDLKDAEQRGINDPSTGEPLLQPEGRKMIERAAEYEAAAAKHPDPATAAALKNEANALRGEARVKHTVKGRTPEKAGDLSQAYAASLTAHGLLQDIKDLRGQEGWESDITKTPEYQAMRSRYAASKAITGKALQLGSMDEGTNTMLDELFGGDPTAWRGTEGSIDAAISMLEQRTGNMLRAEGYRGAEGFKFPGSGTKAKGGPADAAAKKARGGQTTSQIEKSIGPSSVTRKLYYPLGGSEDTGRAKRDAAAAAELADADLPGVSKDVATGLRELGSLANSGDEKQATRARQNLAELATAGPTEKRIAAIEVMRQSGMTAEADAATAALPADMSKTVQALQTTGLAPANDNVAGLESAARNGDGAARFRLVQMAGMPGPGQKEAGAALIRLTKGTR